MPPEPPGIGQISWHELATSDFEAGYDFYTDLFGWEIKRTWIWARAGCTACTVEAGSFPLGGMFTKPGGDARTADVALLHLGAERR